MKTHLLFTTALLLATTPTVLAWPFVKESGSFVYKVNEHDTTLRQHLAVQIDADHPLEIFAGGLLLQQTAFGQYNQHLTHSPVSLPLPDTDPYPSSNPNVNFESGRGDAGDIDGDGDMDLIYTALLKYGTGKYDTENNNVRIVACRNNGDGTWTRHWQFKDVNASTAGAPEVKLADLDRDGDLDLIETHNGLLVRWNEGDGIFNSAPTVLRSTVFPYVPELEVADFDRNGWPDIAIMAKVAPNPALPFDNLIGRVELLSNNGGVFTTSVLSSNAGQQDIGPSAVADLDRDGKPDLLSMQSSPLALVWRQNTGSGFQLPVVIASFTSEVAFAAADMNADGLLDIVLNVADGGVQWLRGLGGVGVFAPAAVLIPGTGNAANPILNLNVADRDGDGDQDITLSGTFYANTTPHLGAESFTETWSGTNPSGAVDLEVADLNNDGRADLIATDPGAPIARILWYAGTGYGLNSPSTISTNNLVPLGVTAGDFSGDGRTDLAWTTNGLLTQALSPSATFSTYTTSNIATMSGITRILATDMDRDGDTDILSVSPTGGTVRYHSNNGTGASWLPQNVETGLINPDRIAVGQLRAGGRPEVAVLRVDATDIYRHSTNTGWDGGAVTYPQGATGSRALLIADIDASRPGAETIFALNNNTIRIWSETNNFLGTLLTSPQPVKQLAAADWNADGFDDLLVATTAGVNLYRGSNDMSGVGNPITSNAIPLLTGVSLVDLVTMDLNGDSLPDAVAVDTTGQLHLIHNRSTAVKVTTNTYPTQVIPPGYSTSNPLAVAGVNAIYQGTNSPSATPDVPAVPDTIRLRFLRSTPVGGVDAPGTVLTSEEVTALVDSISLTQDVYTLQTAPAITVLGGFVFNPTPSVRQSLRISYNVAKSYEMKLNLRATAASAPVTRFYVEHDAASSWLPMDAAGDLGPLPLSLTRPAENTRTLVIIQTPTALENWRMTWFGQYQAIGTAANDFDADGDGVPNLLEYVASRNPRAATGLSELANPLVMVSGGPGDKVIAEVRTLATFDPKVRVRIQETTTLQFWSNMSTRDGGSAWVGKTPTTTNLSGGRALYKFNTNISPNDEPKYFLRLVADELP